jgi:hypothetical protein
VDTTGEETGGLGKIFHTKDPRSHKTTKGPEPQPADDDLYLKDLPADHAALIRALGRAQSAAHAREKLAALGGPALGSLQDAALLSTDPAVQGWAIEVISHIDDERADMTLELIHSRDNVSMLVRTWAAAARIQKADSIESLADLAALSRPFPALARPLGLRATALLSPDASAGELLILASATPGLREALGPAILSKGAPSLMDSVLQGADDGLRRSAASYVGALGRQGKGVAKVVATRYAFEPGAKDIPWRGGALYVPNLAWQKPEALALVSHLIEWHLYCDLKGLAGEQRQLYNNLRSIGLFRPAGLSQVPTDTHGLLHALASAAGRAPVQAMLSRHGATDNPRYDLDRSPEYQDRRGPRSGRRR